MDKEIGMTRAKRTSRRAKSIEMVLDTKPKVFVHTILRLEAKECSLGQVFDRVERNCLQTGAACKVSSGFRYSTMIRAMRLSSRLSKRPLLLLLLLLLILKKTVVVVVAHLDFCV